MAEYKNLTRTDLEDGYVLCENVQLPSGSFCTVYFSPRGIYVLSGGTSTPQNRYSEISELLGTSRIRLYLLSAEAGVGGLYDPETNTLHPELDDEALTADIEQWLDKGYMVFSRSVTERMISQLKAADITARGYSVTETGELYLLKHGRLRKASPVSTEAQYYLTLFGGTLGIHRFAMGKIMSGLAYLFTGGLFLCGWLLDLWQLFLGIQKDRKKQYLFPLKHRVRKLLLLPLGLAVGFSLFLGYIYVLELSGTGMQVLMKQQVYHQNPQTVERFINSIASYFTQ